MLTKRPMRRAVIDIGTNTVKLLVADVEHGTVQPVIHMDATTRLGEGVNQTRRLAPAAIARTVEVIGRYVAEARSLGARDVLALTTSATRTATNAAEFLQACPIPVELISGEREAELVFRGVASDPAWAGQRLLVMDVGGGSAEWILGRGNTIERVQSLPVGAVRLLEQFGNDFADLAAYLRAALAGALAPYRPGPWRLIGTGGAIVTLANIVACSGEPPHPSPIDQARLSPIDHAIFSLTSLRSLVTHLNSLPLAERKQVPGLPPERADIIVTGGAVFLFAMEALAAQELTVSVRALRFGALLEPRTPPRSA